jgi:aspartate kinase
MEVDWELTQKMLKKNVNKILNITQGFLGSDEIIFTTLGRESDYTAAIFAYCLNAKV